MSTRPFYASTRLAIGILAFITSIALGTDEGTDSRAVGARTTRRMLQIAVVDRSGSMGSGRLATAVAELKQLARQLPPTPETPWVVIPFNSTASEPRWLTNGFDELAAYLDSLEAEGGTCIAAGLEMAIKVVRACDDVRYVTVALYTDGEDTNQAALEAQQEILGKLFDERSERGLGQMVICRRWGAANARLVAYFQKKKGVRVIDAGEARLVNVVLDPVVECTDARWSAAAPGELEVQLSAAVQPRQAMSIDNPPTLHFTCTTDGVQSDGPIEVTADGKARDFVVRVKVPMKGAPSVIDLEFEVSQPEVIPAGSGVVLPTLSRDVVRAQVPVPTLVLRGIIAASLSLAGPPRWSDPLTGKAQFPVRLNLEVREHKRLPGFDPITLNLVPENSARIVQGPSTVTVHSAGNYSEDLVLEMDLPLTNLPLSSVTVSITIAAGILPPRVVLDPEKLSVETSVQTPDKAVTQIEATVGSVSRPQWVNLLEGVASFSVVMRVQVDGPLHSGTTLAMVAPPGVRTMSFVPNTIRRGNQQVTLDLRAQLRPRPNRNRLVFHIQPPPALTALTIRAAKPLDFTVSGPAPVRIALAQDGVVRDQLSGQFLDDTGVASLAIQPVVLDKLPAAATRGISVICRPDEGLQVVSKGPFALNAPVSLRVRAARGGSRAPLLRDRIIRAELSVEPIPSCRQVLGCKHRVVLRQEARLKRILFLGALILLGLTGVFLPARFFWRSQTHDADAALPGVPSG